jgi:hypothetical protein
LFVVGVVGFELVESITSWVGVCVFGEEERTQDMSCVHLGDREIGNIMVGQRAVFNFFLLVMAGAATDSTMELSILLKVINYNFHHHVLEAESMLGT